MIPYFAVSLVVASCCIASQISHRYFAGSDRWNGGSGISKSKFTFFDYFALIILVLFSGMRLSVGTDYDMYGRLYLALPEEDFLAALASSPQEVGYTALAFVLKQYSESPFWIFMITSILSIVPVYAMIKRSSRYLPLAVVLYILLAFYVIPFNIVRQGVAMGLNFYAVRFLDKNSRWFLILNVVAATFHSSVLLVAALQWFARNLVPSKKMLAVILGSSVVFLALLGSLSWIRDLVSLMNPRYETYLDGSQTAGLGTILSLVVSIGLIVYSLFLPADKLVRRYQTFMILGLPFLITGIVATPVARLQYYFAVFVILAIPNQIYKLRGGAAHTLVLVVASLIYFSSFLLSFGGLLPYETVL